MAKEIPEEVRLNVLLDCLDGLGLDEICLRRGVSRGTVVAIVGEVKRGRYPQLGDIREEIDLWRRLSLQFRKGEDPCPGPLGHGFL